MPQEPIREMVRRNGRLVAVDERVPQKATPAHRLNPRRTFGQGKPEGPVDAIAQFLGVVGEEALNYFSPRFEGQDVRLPNESGEIDPRLIKGAILEQMRGGK